jgi:hypothetical protein
MFSSLSRSLRPRFLRGTVTKSSILRQHAPVVGSSSRFVATHNPQENFQPKPPSSLNMEMAQGIQDANLLILRHGVGRQRLEVLAKDDSLPLVQKWQRMMEVSLQFT